MEQMYRNWLKKYNLTLGLFGDEYGLSAGEGKTYFFYEAHKDTTVHGVLDRLADRASKNSHIRDEIEKSIGWQATQELLFLNIPF